MMYFIFGTDTYRLKEKLEEIINQLKKSSKNGLKLNYFDAESGFDGFFESINQSLIFADKKVSVLRKAFGNSGFKTRFLDKKKEFLNSASIIIFYEEGEIKKSDPFFKFLQKNAEIQEFRALDINDLKKWIINEFLKYEINIEKGVVEKLIYFVGNDLWQLSNEIKKLIAFKGGQKIELSDISILVKPKIETDVFKTIDAIASRDRKLALDLMHKHLEKGEPPLYLLSMVNYQFRNILEIKDLIEKNNSYQAILGQSKLHPYVVKKSYFQAQKFSLLELKKIYQKIFQVDLDIKTGRISPEIALDLLITEI